LQARHSDRRPNGVKVVIKPRIIGRKVALSLASWRTELLRDEHPLALDRRLITAYGRRTFDRLSGHTR
jgi:hypothetical protein